MTLTNGMFWLLALTLIENIVIFFVAGELMDDKHGADRTFTHLVSSIIATLAIYLLWSYPWAWAH